MANTTNKRFDSLYRKIYTTKYCRINAYKRTKSWDNFLQIVLFSSNLLLIAASILSFIYKEPVLTILTIIFSVASFSTGLFISTKNFSAQSAEYKRCYNELERLQSELCINPANVSEIEKIYSEMITFSLNHDEQDSYRLKAEYFDDPIVAGEDEKKGKNQKYWLKKYRKALAKDILIKTLISIGIYLVLILFRFLLSLILYPFSNLKK